MRVLEQHTGMTAHQTLLLEMLKDIDIVCKRRRISYQLFAGTALGAVRHHGFIPWDDDVDIIMSRSEYERLLSLKIVRRLLYGDKSSRFKTWTSYLFSGDWLRYPFGGQKSEFAYHGEWVHNLWLDILNKVGLIPFVIAVIFTITSIRSAYGAAVRMLYAFEHGEQGDLFVQKAPAATIETLAQAVLELKHSNLGTTIIGTRHGEKLFEVLVTAEEMMRAEELPGFFRIPADNRDLNYDNYFSKGNPEFGKIEQYTSHNTHRLNVEEMKQLLLKLKLFGGTC